MDLEMPSLTPAHARHAADAALRTVDLQRVL